MSSTTESVSTESESTNEDAFLQGLKNDRDEDTRKCPHNCHGHLEVVEQANDEMVLCQSCRCTPDGVYYPLDDDDETPGVDSGSMGFQAPFFYPNGPSRPVFNPRHSEWDSQLEFRNYGEREEYRVSENIKMVGGFEEAWPDEKVSREDSLI